MTDVKFQLPFSPCVIHVTGPPDSGKTTFGLTPGYSAKRTCFIDDDVKGQTVANELRAAGTPFGRYINLIRLGQGLKEIEFHKAVMQVLDEIEPGQYDLLLFDTYTRFEKTFHSMVEADPFKFKSKYSPMGAIKGAEQWIASFEYEAATLDKLMSKVPVIILTTHLKSHHVGGVRTGKFVPDAMKPVVQKSLFRVWLKHGHHIGGVPDGLVLKRLGRTVDVPGEGIKRTNVLPTKLSPCTWSRIKYYWDNPLGEREPEPNERPSEEEVATIEGHLTEWQRWVLELEAKAKKDQESQQGAVEEAMVKKMKQHVFDLFAQGMKPGQVKDEITGLTPAQTLKWYQEWKAETNGVEAVA